MQDAMAREWQALLAAFSRMAAECGYRALTVEAVTKAAGLPRERFEVHFASKGEALGAAQEQFLERMRREAESSCEAEAGWPERVRAALATVLGRVVETEGLSRALMVEAPGLDFAAGQRQMETLESPVDPGSLAQCASFDHPAPQECDEHGHRGKPGASTEQPGDPGSQRGHFRRFHMTVQGWDQIGERLRTSVPTHRKGGSQDEAAEGETAARTMS